MSNLALKMDRVSKYLIFEQYTEWRVYLGFALSTVCNIPICCVCFRMASGNMPMGMPNMNTVPPAAPHPPPLREEPVAANEPAMSKLPVN